MEDGDLQDVVRGCTNFAPNWFTTTTTTTQQQQQDHDFDFIYSSSFSDLFETSRVLDELEELYKPFYPKIVLSSTSLCDSDSNIRQNETDKLKINEPVEFTCSSAPALAAAATSTSHHHETKYKRRKNQQKRVVHQVGAEGVSADTWAWRKYGQKPIKGSPYPRSYYRCSTLKGCLARKQLERSPTNPETFVITYTGEHCHSRPTKKSSLAGTTRQKFSRTTAAASAAITNTSSITSSPISPTFTTLSPPLSSSAATMEDDERSPQGFNNERANNGDINGQLMCDLKFNDDFFGGFDDLRYDLTYTSSVSQDQYPMIFPAC